MNLNLYTVKGDPQQLLATWRRETAAFAKDDYFLNLVSTTDDGIVIVDVCPTEADFQGWINGDDWHRIRTALGEVTVTRLGELTAGVVRADLVDVIHHAHA